MRLRKLEQAMEQGGRWVRRGRTIVVEIGNAGSRRTAAALPAEEFEARYEEEITRPTLRRGSSGSAVATLQKALRALGSSPGPIDGIFGPMTESAVRAFQSAKRLLVDGVVGAQTWSALSGAKPRQPKSPSRSPARPPGGPPSQPGGDVHIEVPFIGYVSNEPTGCFKRCGEMAAAVGVSVGGPDVRIQIATREDSSGRITIDPAAAKRGLQYIDSELDSGRPVVVGVSYMDSSYNVDTITDHFVIVTTRGRDSNGECWYAFHDPATSHASKGGDANPGNRFRADHAGRLVRPVFPGGPLSSKIYDVSMVRRNL